MVSLTQSSSSESITADKIVVDPQDHRPQKDYLELQTVVTLWKNKIIHHNDSSITAPILFSQPGTKALPPGEELVFRYILSETPGLSCESKDAFFEVKNSSVRKHGKSTLIPLPTNQG